ncbi:MAG: M3 family metallopeptidase [Pseudomonadota bacterium]|nr:M3 family metallopeptidase [Pseudomonadota bacterium]
MNQKALLALSLSLALAACGKSEPPVSAPAADLAAPVIPTTAEPMANNPFVKPSDLYLQAPAFDKIKDAHFAPAFDAGMKEQLTEMDTIAANAEPPSFENTIAAMERSGRVLDRTNKVFGHLTGSNTNDTLDKIESDYAPKFAAHGDAIVLNATLFARIKTLYDGRESLGLNGEQLQVLNQVYRNFARNGALLDEVSKTQLRKLNEEQAALIAKFDENSLKDNNESAVVVDNAEAMAGLDEDVIAAAAAAAQERSAKEPALAGKWLIPLVNTTTQPTLQSARDRGLRERIYKASIERGAKGNAYDNRDIILRMAALRAERAKLLGYPEHATYILEEQMAKTPKAARDILTGMAKPAVAAAKRDAAKLQKLIDAEAAANKTPGFKLAPWDWSYYAEKLRQQEFDLDESQIRPYFEMNSVLENGVFFSANKLYGLTFKERKDLPVYHPDVRVFEVFEENGSTLGLFYADFYARASKRGGAWMNNLVDQARILGTQPVVSNNLNVVKPADCKPTLLTYDEVSTMFHEFGHALHGLFADSEYVLLSGTNTPRDFVEFPSQFNENWALVPEVLRNYGKHYQTGAVIPEALISKIKKAGTFDQGFGTVEYVASSLLDLDWHELTAANQPADVLAFEKASLEKNGVAMDEIMPRYRSTYFSHVFPGGYSAGYYSYLWCEVLDADAFQAFNDAGGLNRANGDKFRKMVLSRGSMEDVRQMYVNWRGAEPRVDGLMKRRGFKG